MLAVTVSGSFHRHMSAITSAVHELAAHSIRVLSPADPRVVAAQGEFLFVASDRLRSVRLVQDRHLESIRAATFVWLVCPDGYVGQSASMEIGYAAGTGVPIYATHAPNDLTLREYVRVVPTLQDAIRGVQRSSRSRRSQGILIDPHPSIDEAHDLLEQVQSALKTGSGTVDPARGVYERLSRLQAIVAPVTH
jgi:hypothetical protein